MRAIVLVLIGLLMVPATAATVGPVSVGSPAVAVGIGDVHVLACGGHSELAFAGFVNEGRWSLHIVEQPSSIPSACGMDMEHGQYGGVWSDQTGPGCLNGPFGRLCFSPLAPIAGGWRYQITFEQGIVVVMRGLADLAFS